MTEQDINSRFHDLMKATWDAFDSAVILRLGFIEYYGYPEGTGPGRFCRSAQPAARNFHPGEPRNDRT